MNGRSLVGCLGVAALLVGVGGAAWWALRGDIDRQLDRRPAAAAAAPSAEDGAASEAKLRRLTEGETVRLSDREVNGLLHHQLSGWIPAAFSEPGVRLASDSMVLSGRVATRDLPATRELEAVRFFLPDTAEVAIGGRLEPMGQGRVAFDVDAFTIANVPIPRRMHATLLQQLGRQEEPGLAPTAIAFPLPEGIASARVERDSLVLVPAARD